MIQEKVWYEYENYVWEDFIIVFSYWLDWLVLRDILNTACNITSAVYKGVGGGRVWGVALTLPVETADQAAMCLAGQTDGHSSPPTTSQVDTQWSSLGSKATPSIPSVVPQCLFWPLMTWQGQQKALCKADLLIYGNIVTVSRQCLSVAIVLSNKMDFNFVNTWMAFPNPITYIMYFNHFHCFVVQ